MVLVHIAFLFSKMHSKSYTINGRDSFLSAIIIKAQPLVVFAWLSDRAVVHLSAIHSVSLQLFI